jgi:hypothetical protein
MGTDKAAPWMTQAPMKGVNGRNPWKQLKIDRSKTAIMEATDGTGDALQDEDDEDNGDDANDIQWNHQARMEAPTRMESTARG